MDDRRSPASGPSAKSIVRPIAFGQRRQNAGRIRLDAVGRLQKLAAAMNIVARGFVAGRSSSTRVVGSAGIWSRKSFDFVARRGQFRRDAQIRLEERLAGRRHRRRIEMALRQLGEQVLDLGG